MKVCNEYRLLINLYIDGELDAAEALQVEEHLSRCPACRRYCDEICMVNRAVKDVEPPKDLHVSIMSAVRAAQAAEEEKVVAFPKEHRRSGKKQPRRWIGTVAAMLAVACVGIFGMEGGLTAMFRGVTAEEAAMDQTAMKLESAVESTAAPELKAAAPVKESEAQPENTVQPIRIEENMTSWFIDTADHVAVVDSGAAIELRAETEEAPDNEAQENAADAAPEENGKSDVLLNDERLDELDMLLGEGAEGYGFYLVAAGRTKELPVVFADQIEQADAGCTLMITVRNDQEVYQQIMSGLTEGGFEIREIREERWFQADPSAEEGLIIVLLTE